MKKLIIFLPLLLFSFLMYAQHPNGGQRMPPSDGNGRPPMERGGQKKMMFNSITQEIPDLTLEQREKLSTLLTNENDKIESQITKKMDLEREGQQNLSDKDSEKKIKKLEKIDEKIVKIKKDTNKKAKKILTDNQYSIFEQKRNQIKFDKRPMGERPQRPREEANQL